MKKIKILFFSTLIFMLLFSSINTCNAALFTDLFNRKKINQSSTYAFLENEKAVQGSCSDGRYIYLALVSKESDYTKQETTLAVINAKTKKLVKRVSLGKTGHSNSLAYNPNNKTIVIAPCSSNINVLFKVNIADILNLDKPPVYKVNLIDKKGKIIPNTISAITFDAKTDQYYIRWGNKKLKVFDQNFQEVKDIHVNANFKPLDSYIGQSIFVNSNHIYYIYNSLTFGLKNSINFVRVYKIKNGKGILEDTHIITDTDSEFESMFIANNKLCAISNGIEKIKNRNTYRIKLFELNF